MDMDCEVCGKSNVVAVTLIEGAKLNTCIACSRMGKQLHRLEQTSGKQVFTPTSSPMESEEIVENYSAVIKRRRESLSLSLTDLAHKINETVGFLDHIEKGKLIPTIALAKKLEKELKIKLIETNASVGASVINNPSFKEATLGDILEAQKKKNK